MEVLERNEVLEQPAASNENNGPSNGHAKPTDEMASIDGTQYAQPTGAADDPVRLGFASDAPLRPVWDADSRLQMAAEHPAAEQPAEQLAMPTRSSPRRPMLRGSRSPSAGLRATTTPLPLRRCAHDRSTHAFLSTNSLAARGSPSTIVPPAQDRSPASCLSPRAPRCPGGAWARPRASIAALESRSPGAVSQSLEVREAHEGHSRLSAGHDSDPQPQAETAFVSGSSRARDARSE